MGVCPRGRSREHSWEFKSEHMVLCRGVGAPPPSKNCCLGLNCVPQTRYFEILTPEPMKVILPAHINSFPFYLIPASL